MNSHENSQLLHDPEIATLCRNLSGKAERVTLTSGVYLLVFRALIQESCMIGIVARIDGEYAGHVNFHPNGESWFASSVNVKLQHQRNGVATAMYDFAASGGLKIVRSDKLFSDGRALWASQETRKMSLSICSRHWVLPKPSNQSTRISPMLIDRHTGEEMWIDLLAVPYTQRRNGIGRYYYETWERALPADVRLIRLRAEELLGGEPSYPFWKAMGFVCQYTGPGRWIDEKWSYMWKGVNGHKTPPSILLDGEEK